MPSTARRKPFLTPSRYCLIDGAARRHRLIAKWAGKGDPSQEFDSDEGLEALLRRELIDIACFNGVSDPETLRDIV
jgi:hypothetical protein